MYQFIDFSDLYKWTVHEKSNYHNGPQHHTKLKQIDRFGDAN